MQLKCTDAARCTSSWPGSSIDSISLARLGPPTQPTHQCVLRRVARLVLARRGLTSLVTQLPCMDNGHASVISVLEARGTRHEARGTMYNVLQHSTTVLETPRSREALSSQEPSRAMLASWHTDTLAGVLILCNFNEHQGGVTATHQPGSFSSMPACCVL